MEGRWYMEREGKREKEDGEMKEICMELIGMRGGRVTQREVQVYYYYEESESRRNI